MDVRKLTRRGLLGIGVVGGASLVSFALAKEVDVVVAVLSRRLAPMGIDPAQYRVFAHEYVQRRREHRRALRLVSTFAALLRWVTPYPHLPMRSRMRRMEDNVVSLFLLSTDYFEHEQAGGRAVRYVGFYDPYEHPCRRIFGSA